MATASVPNTFANSGVADADEMNANFAALVTFLNNSVYHLDGSKVLTADFDGGGQRITNVAAPTASTDAATKAYVDEIAAGGQWTSADQTYTAGTAVTWDTEVANPLSWTESSGVFTCPSGGDGLYKIVFKWSNLGSAKEPRFYVNDTLWEYPVWYTWDDGTTEMGQMQVTMWFEEGDTFECRMNSSITYETFGLRLDRQVT